MPSSIAIPSSSFKGTLSDKDSGAMSAYNKDMKALVKATKKMSGYDKDTYYLLMVPRSSNSTLSGYMPVNSNIGFIFTEACNSQDAINCAIAHELGHGAFHLWHTFSTENKYQASQGTTTNLMDYSNTATATDLYKYQWDYIHNPEFVIFRGDDEESEAWSEGTRYKCISTELATRIKEKYRYFYYPDGSIVDMKDHLPSGFYLSTDVDAVTSYGAVATIREGDRDLFYDFSRSNNNANVGYGYRLNGNAICKYKLPSISSEKASELNPVHVRLKENQVTIIDFMGHELESFVDDVCDCQMAEYTFSSELEPIVEDENQEYWFYDKKENKIVIVSKVHDLSWLKTKGSISYDEVMEFNPGEIRMTEAQLSDSKYNWLRNDVIKAMNDGGKVVMVGLAATALAPYLIEYAATYGIEAGTAVLQNTCRKLGTDFVIGSGFEAINYLLAEYIDKKLLSDPSRSFELGKDFLSDVIFAGFENMVKPSEKIKTISTCLNGVNIDELFDSDDDVSIRILRASIECSASVGLNKLFDLARHNQRIQKLKDISSEKIVMAIRKLKLNNPDAELELMSLLCGKNSYWLSEMKRIIKENGDGAFYMLQDLDLDYMKISQKNFERLSVFVKNNLGNENELSLMKSLLSSERDINRMLRYIDGVNFPFLGQF